MVSLAVVLGFVELSRLTQTNTSISETSINIILAWLLCFSSLKPNWLDLNLVISLAVVLPFLMAIVRRDPPSAIPNISSALLGIMYVGWLFGRHLILLRQMQHGLQLIVLLISITWSGDIGAFLIGRRWGKHKLIPAISPGKSLEGYIAGIVFACATAMLIHIWLLQDVQLLHIIILGAMLTVVGQLGDLAESLLKRAANVKDSGSVMPGHGGILDRCDSMIFIAPALYYYSTFVIHLS